MHARHRSHRGLLLTVLILAVAMTGCARPDPSAELAARIDTLIDEVDALGEELAVVRSEVAAARDELAEVNDDARLTRELLAAGGPRAGSRPRGRKRTARPRCGAGGARPGVPSRLPGP